MPKLFIPRSTAKEVLKALHNSVTSASKVAIAEAFKTFEASATEEPRRRAKKEKMAEKRARSGSPDPKREDDVVISELQEQPEQPDAQVLVETPSPIEEEKKAELPQETQAA